MGKEQSKEKVIIAQNAAGGENAATAAIDVLKNHASITNALLGVLVVLVVLGIFACSYRQYKKAHTNWIRREITLSDLRRSLRKRPPLQEGP